MDWPGLRGRRRKVSLAFHGGSREESVESKTLLKDPSTLASATYTSDTSSRDINENVCAKANENKEGASTTGNAKPSKKSKIAATPLISDISKANGKPTAENSVCQSSTNAKAKAAKKPRTASASLASDTSLKDKGSVKAKATKYRKAGSGLILYSLAKPAMKPKPTSAALTREIHKKLGQKTKTEAKKVAFGSSTTSKAKSAKETKTAAKRAKPRKSISFTESLKLWEEKRLATAIDGISKAPSTVAIKKRKNGPVADKPQISSFAETPAPVSSAVSPKKVLSDPNNNQLCPVSPLLSPTLPSSAAALSPAVATSHSSASTATAASNHCSNAASTTSAATALVDLDALDGPQSMASILDEIEKFASEFKDMRIKKGFTQMDISKILATINPNVSQTTISRFENLSLSFLNILRLKPYFELLRTKIVDELDGNKLRGLEGAFIDLSFDDASSSLTKKRKREKRTEISPQLTRTLEKCFSANPKPSAEEIQVIVDHCGLETRVVRVWFCNRRAKQRFYEREIRLGI